MIKLDQYDSQLILYAKGHFERNQEIEDVRRILAWRALVPYENFSDRDVITCLIMVLQKCDLFNDRNIHEIFSQVIFGYKFDVYSKPEKKKTPLETFIATALDAIAVMPVKNESETLIELEAITEECGLKKIGSI